MKLDKETLVKHQFWFLLGLAGTCTLVAIAIIFLGPAKKVTAARAAYAKAKEDVGPKAPKDLKNGKFTPPWEARQNFFAGHKATVWKEAWQTQTDVMTWPAGLADYEKAYFGDTIRPRELLDYKSKFYDTQFVNRAAFFRTVDGAPPYFPVAFDEKKIFAKRTWKEEEALSVEEAWLAQEEIWVRREVLRILETTIESIGRFKEDREPLWTASLPALAGGMLTHLLLADPESYPGAYKNRPLPDKDLKGKALKGIVKSRLFRNYNWEVNLLLEPEAGSPSRYQISPHSTIKNINPLRRALLLMNGGTGLRLRAHQGDQTRNLEAIEGVVVRYGEQVEFTKATASKSVDFRQDFWLEEIFQRSTSPVKDLLELEVGVPKAVSHRFAESFVLVPGRLTPAPPPEEAENKDAPASGPGGPGGMMGGGPSSMMGSGPGAPMGKGGASATDKDFTPNGIPRKRYVLSNNQVRRLPFAFTILVDQAHRNEVLSAMANSRLRVQTTQSYWAHNDVPAGTAGTTGTPSIPSTLGGGGRLFIPGDTEGSGSARPGSGKLSGIRPSGGGSDGPRGTGGPTVGGGPPMGGSGGSGGPRGSGGPGGPRGDMPPMGGDGTVPGGEQGDAAADSAAEANRNLVKLTVYGVAALFERYPPRQKPSESETKPAETVPPKP